jgi:hypothetical protein
VPRTWADDDRERGKGAQPVLCRQGLKAAEGPINDEVPMTNNEIRSNARMTKLKFETFALSFGTCHSFVLRHSSFVI